MANELRTRDGLPFNFVDGLRIKGVDVTNWDKVFIDQGASYVGFQPVGNLAATNVQAAIAELESEKQSKSEPIANATTAVNLRPGANQGIVWDNDAFGGTQDTASITLETASGEATKMRFKMTNDSDDNFEFTAKTADGLTSFNNAMTLNGNVLLNAANYVDYAAPMIVDYAALRAYVGNAAQVRITSNGLSGFFYRDDADTSSVDNGGTVIVSSNGKRWKRIYDGAVNVKWFGATGNGGDDDTQAFHAARDSEAGAVCMPPGIYRVSLLIDKPVRFIGAGVDSVTLRPVAGGTAVVISRGATATADHLGHYLSDVTIDCEGTTAIGLQIGSTSAGFDYSNGTVERVVIKNGLGIGLDFKSSTNSSFSQVYVYNFDIGFKIDAERNVQLNTFKNCRFRLCRYGADLQSGNRENFIGCNWESNTEVGIRLLRQTTSGPSHSIFQTCWLENNGPDSGLSTNYASIILDINNSVQTSSPHNLIFQDCNITSKNGAYDVRAVRANLVEFNRCSFSAVSAGGFSINKFSSTSLARVKIINCGSLNELPSPALYSAFPELIADSNAQLTSGFEYLFEYDGHEYTNKKWLIFVPAIVGSVVTGSGTYTNQQGRYRRAGNIVHFNIRLDWTAHTGTGNMDITGLPFVSNSASVLSTCAVYYSSLTLSASSILMARLGTNTNVISLRQMASGGGVGADTVPMDTAGSLILSGFYEV